jgi:hypothetical protein
VFAFVRQANVTGVILALAAVLAVIAIVEVLVYRLPLGEAVTIITTVAVYIPHPHPEAEILIITTLVRTAARRSASRTRPADATPVRNAAFVLIRNPRIRPSRDHWKFY